MPFSEYVKQIRLAIALNDKVGLEVLINRYLIGEDTVTLKD